MVVLTPRPSASVFCLSCAAEKVSSLGKDWHKLCLKCDRCNKLLNAGGHAEVSETPLDTVQYRPLTAEIKCIWYKCVSDILSEKFSQVLQPTVEENSTVKYIYLSILISWLYIYLKAYGKLYY